MSHGDQTTLGLSGQTTFKYLEMARQGWVGFCVWAFGLFGAGIGDVYNLELDV